MAWFAVHEDIEGPKLRHLFHLLNCPLWEAEGILMSLWRWGIKNAYKDGLIPHASRDDIAQALSSSSAGSTLDVLKVVDALVEAGWIDESETESGEKGLYIHDWAIWQEQWYKAQERREKDVVRKRKSIKNKEAHNSAQDSPEFAPGKDPDGEPGEPIPDEEKAQKYAKDFETFWSAYPRKIDKGMAYKKYLARRRDGYSPDELLTAALNYADSCRKKKTEKEFIKHAKTFLGDSAPFIDFLPKSDAETTSEVPEMSNPFAKYVEAQ